MRSDRKFVWVLEHRICSTRDVPQSIRAVSVVVLPESQLRGHRSPPARLETRKIQLGPPALDTSVYPDLRPSKILYRPDRPTWSLSDCFLEHQQIKIRQSHCLSLDFHNASRILHNPFDNVGFGSLLPCSPVSLCGQMFENLLTFAAATTMSSRSGVQTLEVSILLDPVTSNNSNHPHSYLPAVLLLHHLVVRSIFSLASSSPAHLPYLSYDFRHDVEH